LAKIFKKRKENQNNSLDKPKKSKKFITLLVNKKGQNLWEKDFMEGVGTLPPYGNFKPTRVKIRNAPLSSQKMNSQFK